MGLKLILLLRENTSEDTEIQLHQLTNPPCKKANWMFPERALLCPAQCSAFDKYRGWTWPSFLWQVARNAVGSQQNPIHYPGTMWPCSLCTSSRWKILRKFTEMLSIKCCIWWKRDTKSRVCQHYCNHLLSKTGYAQFNRSSSNAKEPAITRFRKIKHSKIAEWVHSFLALLQELYKKRIWLGFLLELPRSFRTPTFLHTYTTRSWEADGFGGKSMRTHLLLSALTSWCAQTGTPLLPPLLQGRRKTLGSCVPRELAGTTRGLRALLQAETSSALQTWSTKCLCSLTRPTAPSRCAPWLLIWATTDVKTLHKWFLLFGLLPF